MKKRNNRAQKVNEIRWEEVADWVKERAVVWAIDVAFGTREIMRAIWITSTSTRSIMATCRWWLNGPIRHFIGGAGAYPRDWGGEGALDVAAGERRR